LSAKILDDAAIGHFLHDSASHVHGHPSIQLPQSPYDQSAPLREESLLRLASAPSLSLADQGDKLIFHAYHKTYNVPVSVKPALLLLNDQQGVSLAQMCAALDGEIAVVSLKQGLAILARAGVVLVETE
jgi:hypothetical protein